MEGAQQLRNTLVKLLTSRLEEPRPREGRGVSTVTLWAQGESFGYLSTISFDFEWWPE